MTLILLIVIVVVVAPASKQNWRLSKHYSPHIAVRALWVENAPLSPPFLTFSILFCSIVVVSIDSTLSNDRARQSIKYAVMNACIDSTPFLWNFGFPKLFRTIWKGEGASINHVIVFTNQIS